MPRIHRCYMVIYGSLQAEFMETKHKAISIGMEHQSLVTFLFIYLSRSKMILKYFGGC